MKSVLVIDTPKDCGGCPCIHDELWMCQADKEYREANYSGRPSWCPLKPLPHKKMPKQGEAFPQDMRLIDRWRGWDACIDEIVGETE